MSQIKNALENIANCGDCGGKGYIGWATKTGEYDFDWCDCNPRNFDADTIQQYTDILN